MNEIDTVIVADSDVSAERFLSAKRLWVPGIQPKCQSLCKCVTASFRSPAHDMTHSVTEIQIAGLSSLSSIGEMRRGGYCLNVTEKSDPLAFELLWP